MAGGPKGKVANSLVAVSSAAVLAVYAAGYSRTRSAAAKFESQATDRRPAPPAPVAQTSAPVAPIGVAPIRSDVAADDKKGKGDKPDAAAPLIAAEARLATVEAPSPNHTPDTTTAPTPEPAPGAVSSPAPPPPPAAPIPTPPPSTPVWKDGTYTGWGSSRHGDIQASVIVEGGRIASATIAQCLTRYSCDVIEKLPPEVAQRQSAEVDYVSGATQSTNAFYYAVVDALNKAK